MKIRARYVRYRSFDRLRHSSRFYQWLVEQGARLDKSPEEVFDMLKSGLTAAQVEGEASVGPINIELPVITGTAQEGETLTVTPGEWEDEPDVTGQWTRDDEPIEGATDLTYDIQAEDVGAMIGYAETAEDEFGSTTVFAEPVGPIEEA